MSSIQTLRKVLLQNTTGEYIDLDAPHWALEPYIPLLPDALLERLLERDECSADQQAGYRQFARTLAAVLHHDGRAAQTELSHHYASLDPDNETLREQDQPLGDTVNPAAAAATESIRSSLLAANFTPLSQEEIEAAVGVASHWGVPLHVDFELFRQLAVYTRGDVIGVRTMRPWNRPWRNEAVEVPIYQRVVVLFQLNADCRTEDELDANRLHLRLFKNIPKLDVDMLLPGTRVRISWLDRTRIVVPSLGGIGMTIWKIVRTALLVAALSVYTATILVGLVLAAVGYIVRSVLNYFQTRNRYMLNLTRSLYYQKLDSNAGVLYRLLEEAHQQRQCEVLVAHYAMLTSDQPISRRRLKRRAERMLREILAQEIEFDIDETLQRMLRLDLCSETPAGKFQAATVEQAITSLNAWWDSQPLAV